MLRPIFAKACLLGAAMMALAILFFTHIPTGEVPRLMIMIGNDKSRHIISYGVWAGLMCLGLRPWLVSNARVLGCVLLLGVIFAAADEWTQTWTGRTASFGDFCASLLGTSLGGSLVLVPNATRRFFSKGWRRHATQGRPEQAPSTASETDHLT